MRTRYSKPNSSKPWLNNHVEIKTRRVNSVTRVYATMWTWNSANGEKHTGTRDFASYGQVLELFNQIDDGMLSKGWTRRKG